MRTKAQGNLLGWRTALANVECTEAERSFARRYLRRLSDRLPLLASIAALTSVGRYSLALGETEFLVLREEEEAWRPAASFAVADLPEHPVVDGEWSAEESAAATTLCERLLQALNLDGVEVDAPSNFGALRYYTVTASPTQPNELSVLEAERRSGETGLQPGEELGFPDHEATRALVTGLVVVAAEGPILSPSDADARVAKALTNESAHTAMSENDVLRGIMDHLSFFSSYDSLEARLEMRGEEFGLVRLVAVGDRRDTVMVQSEDVGCPSGTAVGFERETIPFDQVGPRLERAIVDRAWSLPLREDEDEPETLLSVLLPMDEDTAAALVRRFPQVARPKHVRGHARRFRWDLGRALLDLDFDTRMRVLSKGIARLCADADGIDELLAQLEKGAFPENDHPAIRHLEECHDFERLLALLYLVDEYAARHEKPRPSRSWVQDSLTMHEAVYELACLEPPLQLPSRAS